MGLHADSAVSRILNDVGFERDRFVSMSNIASKSEAGAGGDVTRVLERAQKGDPNAAAEALGGRIPAHGTVVDRQRCTIGDAATGAVTGGFITTNRAVVDCRGA